MRTLERLAGAHGSSRERHRWQPAPPPCGARIGAGSISAGTLPELSAALTGKLITIRGGHTTPKHYAASGHQAAARCQGGEGMCPAAQHRRGARPASGPASVAPRGAPCCATQHSGGVGLLTRGWNPQGRAPPAPAAWRRRRQSRQRTAAVAGGAPRVGEEARASLPCPLSPRASLPLAPPQPPPSPHPWHTAAQRA